MVLSILATIKFYAMKKIMFLILSAFLSTAAFSQVVTLEGFLLDQNGLGVGNQTITMNYNSGSGAVSGTATSLTDTNGYYNASFSIAPDSSVFYSYLWNDCNGNLQIDSGFYIGSINLPNVVSYNLAYCGSIMSCQTVASSSVVGSTATLSASGTGTAPFSYSWSNGVSTPTQSLTLANGQHTYCVTVTDANGCTSSDCVTFYVGNTANCQAFLVDSMLSTGNYLLSAQSSGVAPFTYMWSNGSSSQSTTYQLAPGTHTVCCTVTDANGCIDQACTTITVASSSNCSNTISSTIISNYTYQFTSNPTGTAPFSYSWSPTVGASAPTAQTTNYTFNSIGTHVVVCVVTDANGCVSVDSTVVTIAPPPTSTTLSGMVFTDSTVFNDCIVFLIDVDTNAAAGTILTAIDTTMVVQGFYSFTNVPNGAYFIKAALLPSHWQYSNYLASYQSAVPNAVSWQQATLHTVNAPVNSINDIYLTQGVNSGGPAFIGGLVSQGAGKGGDYTPKADVQVFVYDNNNQVAAFAYSNASGVFELPNLAYGDYTVSVDVPGIPTNNLAVTLDAATPTLNNIYVNIEQNEVQITQGSPLSIQEVHNTIVSVYPNPTQGLVTIENNSNNTFTTVQLVDLAGKIVLSEVMNSNVHQIDLSTFNSGVYIIKVNSTEFTQQFLLNKQ